MKEFLRLLCKTDHLLQKARLLWTMSRKDRVSCRGQSRQVIRAHVITFICLRMMTVEVK